MSTFRTYDPTQSLNSRPPKACEECHARKVRCIASGQGDSCQQCLKHGIECRQRSRKRKRLDPQSGDDIVGSVVRPLGREQDGTPNPNDAHERNQATASQARPPLLFAGRGVQHSADASPSASSIDRFHNSSFLNRSAILGQDFRDIDHSNGNTSTHRQEHTLSSIDTEVLHMHNAFDLPDYPERQSLIDAFFDKCWPFMPVVDRSALDVMDVNACSSYLLLQVVLLAGRRMRPRLYPPSVTEALYKRVKALIYAEHERNPLNLLAALCLIQWNTSAAPKDISLNTPRYWTTMAVGIAQQMGLNLKSATPHPDESLRRRIWWTLCARDNLSASAHGRPRLINQLDCTQPPLTMDDFPQPREGRKAQLFLHYVSVLHILGDLCQSIVRQGEAGISEKENVANRLMAFLDSLPNDLRLADANGLPTPYNLHVAQLHINILGTILILYRPKSVFSLGPANAASVAAANLSFRIFEAMELREHTRCLSSAFAWHLLMTSIPLVSCLRVPQLKETASSALDCLEKAMGTLGETRPAAANSLRSMKAIRKAMVSSVESGRHTAEPASVDASEARLSPNFLAMAPALLSPYGDEAVRHYEKLVDQLESSANPEAREQNQDSQQQPDFMDFLGVGESEDQFNFEDLFGPGHSWMMRDWMTET